MEPSSTGGRANWAGATFELRLGVQFCVYILVGEYAGLAPGAARRVQFQAPGIVDDLVLEFDGATWAVQAKSGSSVRVEWSPGSPFGKALRQLYRGATSGQVDLAAGSLDRVVLAVDHQAHDSITAFGQWLEQARQHYEWQSFAAASTGKKRTWAQQLPAFLDAPADEKLLAFLKHLYVQRAPAPDEWQSELRGWLLREGVPDNDTAERALDLLVAHMVQIAPHAGQRDYKALRRACEDVPGLPRPGAPPFRLFRQPTEDELYRALQTYDVRMEPFIERPELAAALDSDQGVLVAGRPGSGKSHALVKLALARPAWPVLVVARHFCAEDLSRLLAQLRRVHSSYQLLWDDVHDKPDLFADAVLRLAEQGDRVRVLAAYREQHKPDVAKRVTPEFCRRAGIVPEPLQLQPFDADQATDMAQAVAGMYGLGFDGATTAALARHVERGDGGPLFAIAIGRLLQDQAAQGEPVRAADVARLPDDLRQTWRSLYERLAEQPNGFVMQNVLGVLRFLRQIACPLDARLVELVFTHVLGHGLGELNGAAQALARAGWLRREAEGFVAHDVTLEAVPGEPGVFHRFAQFAHQEIAGETLALGLLRGSLSSFYWGRVPHTRTVEERRALVVEAVELGQMAAAGFRAAGHDAHMATALNNTSNAYSELAGLEETRGGRMRLLGQAVAAIEEAAAIYRELGLQAELATSLNNASNRYSDLAGLEEGRAGRVRLLGQAVAAIEEAIGTFRAQGIIPYLMIGLANAVRRHVELAQQTGELDRAHVLALCQEGEALCEKMEDHQRLAFFRQVRQQLEGGGD